MWLDASTSHARPPAGVSADPSQYGLVGGRLSTEFDWGAVMLSGRYGEAFWGSAGKWVQGEAAGVIGGRIGPVGVRTTLSGFGLEYLHPFQYDAGGFEVQPTVSIPIGSYSITLLPRASAGSWRADSLHGHLRITGGELELQRAIGPVSAMISGGLLDVENGATAGNFGRAGASLTLDRGHWSAQVRLQAQRTPLERELGGGVRLAFRLAPGLELLAQAGRTLRDPLFGTAGTYGFSLSATLRAARWSAPRSPDVAAVGERQDGGRMVHFAIRAPEAETVALTGDFTGWEPVTMAPGDDGWWRLSRVLPGGLHHFGFLVDGQWAIPAGAPGVVDDGWGRQNASVVVEP